MLSKAFHWNSWDPRVKHRQQEERLSLTHFLKVYFAEEKDQTCYTSLLYFFAKIINIFYIFVELLDMYCKYIIGQVDVILKINIGHSVCMI